MERIESLFTTIWESDLLGRVINPLWAVILKRVEEAWHCTGSISHPPSPSSSPQAQWDRASFFHLPAPKRRSHAFLGETMKGTENQSVLEEPTVESLPSKREDSQPTREESVKGHDTIATTTSPLPSSLDPTPAVSRDERLSGPERDQLAKPWANAKGPGRLSTRVVEPLQDRVPPHLELFFAQELAVPVRCAMRSFLSILWNPFSRSVLPRGWYARPILSRWGRRCVLIIPGEGLLSYAFGRRPPPPPPPLLGLRVSQLVRGALRFWTFCVCLLPMYL